MTKQKIIDVLEDDVKAKNDFIKSIRIACACYNGDLGNISAQNDVLHQNITSAPALEAYEAITLPNDFVKEIRDTFFSDIEAAEKLGFSEVIVPKTSSYTHISFKYGGVKFEGYYYE